MNVTVTNGVIDGTIVVHSPGRTSRGKVSGTASGDTIQFGAITNVPVTFTGKVAGDRTFGTYQATDGRDRGTWKATRAPA